MSIDGGTAPFQYNWSNGANTKDVSNLGIGFYSVTVSDANGCNFKKENIEIINEIDPNSSYEKNIFSLTPNPASEQFILFSAVVAELKIYSKNGEKVLTAQINKGANNFSTQNLPNGTYTLQLKSAEKNRTFNLVVIH